MIGHYNSYTKDCLMDISYVRNAERNQLVKLKIKYD